MNADTLKKAKEIIKSKKYNTIKSKSEKVSKIFDTIFNISYGNINVFLEQINDSKLLWDSSSGAIHKLNIENLAASSGGYYAVQIDAKDISLAKIHEEVSFPFIHSDVSKIRIITISNKTALKSGVFTSFTVCNSSMNIEVLFFVPYSKKSTKYMIISDNTTNLPIYYDEVGSTENFRIPTKENLKVLLDIPKKINNTKVSDDEFIRISSYCGKKMSNIMDKMSTRDRTIYEFLRIFNTLDKNWTKKSALSILHLLTGDASYFENYGNSKSASDSEVNDEPEADTEDEDDDNSLDAIVAKYEQSEENMMEAEEDWDEEAIIGSPGSTRRGI